MTVVRASRFFQSAAAVAALMSTACRLSPSEFRTIDAWLNCDECTNGERASVRAMGFKAVPRLSISLEGPSSRTRELMRAKFGESYRLARISTVDSAQYADTLFGNYLSTYQKRAAMSLADIGGWQKPTSIVPLTPTEFWSWRAKSALDAAIRDSSARHYRPDVIQAIQVARETFYTERFDGAVRPSHLGFGELIALVASPQRHFTGNETVRVADGLFPSAQIPVFRSGDTVMTFVVADVGPHLLELRRAAGASETQLAPFTVTSLLDQSDRAVEVCGETDTVCIVSRAPMIVVSPNGPYTAFVSLVASASETDSVDVFKLRPSASQTVTARLDWYGPANLDLNWRRCSPMTPVGNTNGATLSKPETTTEVIPANECRILLIALRQHVGVVVARLRITSQ